MSMDPARLDADLEVLASRKQEWARLALPEKLRLLRATQEGVARVSERWVAAAVREKGIPDGSPLAGEEWMSGPYSLLFASAALERTIGKLARGESPLPPPRPSGRARTGRWCSTSSPSTPSTASCTPG